MMCSSPRMFHQHHQQQDSNPRKSVSWSKLGASARQHQMQQQKEMNSIRDMLEHLQQNCAPSTNESSSLSNHDHEHLRKEFAIRHYPNGDLFSGNIDTRTKELVFGRMTCALDMEIYEGPFSEGRRHGSGAVCSKMDGSAKFLGRYHEGQMHSGTLISTNFTYTGTFLDDNFHGIGTMVSRNGSIYQGQFGDGKYHGVGILRSVMGNVCHDEDAGGGVGNDGRDPSWLEEVERVYTGDFVDGLFSGFGTLLTQSANGLPSFIGTWCKGKRVEGIETLPNGDIYEGKFVNELREGPGVLRIKASTRPSFTKCGIWEGGVLKENVDLTVEFENGNCYSGEHINSVPHGFGKMDYADTGWGKSSYIGSFVNGVRHGEGRCSFHKTGEMYEGEWSFDEPIGLKNFQHEGPLVEGGSAQEDKIVVTIEPSPRPPIDQPRRCSNSSMLSTDEEWSLDEGVRMSPLGINIVIPDTAPHTTSSFRQLQSTSTDSLSQIMKSPLVFNNLEEPIKRHQYSNGDVFEGCLDKGTGLRQGVGVFTEHRMGCSYRGDWKQSKRHGTGHLKLASGVQYSGEFYDDKIHGQGRLLLINGSEYTGSFVNGLFHGHGVLEDFRHRRVYSGEFENGERAGEGEETLSDGSRFKGEYKQGKRNGFGILYGPDNSVVYRGEWRDDLQHGRGLLFCRQTEENDGVYEGDFVQNKFCGSGKFTYNDKTSIEGQWLDGKPMDGDWCINYSNGSKFYGFATFRVPRENTTAATTSHDILRVPVPHGFGSFLCANGRRDVGSFVYGKKDADYEC